MSIIDGKFLVERREEAFAAGHEAETVRSV